MSELIKNREFRINLLRELILDLHKGKSVDEVKERFREIVKDVSHDEVAAMEQTLIQEGLPVEEIQRLCDVHASIFKDALEKEPEPETIPGHPVYTLKLENQALQHLISQEINPRLEALKNAEGEEELKRAQELRDKLNMLRDADKHYKKKEELLFPYLEKSGITAPPKVMWGVDDEIRRAIKEACNFLKDYKPANKTAVIEKVKNTVNRVTEMIYKEEKILFPMALDTLTEDEWYEIYRQSPEIGFCLINPTAEWKRRSPSLDKKQEVIADDTTSGVIGFKTGMLAPEEIELIFNTLPVDITFVDKNDTVKYFSSGKERIFSRTTTVIGRKVQNCHPPASINIVEKLLQDFKEGRKDIEEFWLTLQGKMIYIRYFAVRDENGKYIGTLEVTQDIGRIKALEGEKRLVD